MQLIPILLSVLLSVLPQKLDKDLLKRYDRCWSAKNSITLLDTIQSAMRQQIEDEYLHHDFIQTFGCAYEEEDIERNSIRAVYRAVIQSIRNRNIEMRDDLEAILYANPPRPDNLMREYSVYTNITVGTEKKAARYEIKILDLIAVPTLESSVSVWTRLVTRFAYKEDFNKVKEISYTQSEFVQVMGRAQEILEEIERRNFTSAKKILDLKNIADVYPEQIDALYFGDSMQFFEVKKMDNSFLGIYLGKGIIACNTPTQGVVVFKFGEERLYDLMVDIHSYRRTTTIFQELNYQAPEAILQCLFIKFSQKKPNSLTFD